MTISVSHLGTVTIDAKRRQPPLRAAEAVKPRATSLSASLASESQSIVEELERSGKLPANLPANLKEKMLQSLTKYFGDVSASKIQQFADKAASVIQQELRTVEEARPEVGEGATAETGLNPATGRSALGSFIEDVTGADIGAKMNMDFFLRIAREVVQGGVQYVAQNWDQTRIDEFPALELHRVYDRDVPRGSEKDPKGPENGWSEEDARWQAALDDSEDEDAAKVFEDTGRMVALKDSDVWDSLGNLEDYDDCLGNAFAPFAFNSGMATDEVPYDEAVELGLLDDGEKVKGADVDFNTLFDLPEDLEARYEAAVSRLALQAAASSRRTAKLLAAGYRMARPLEAGAATSKRGCLMAIVPGDIAAQLQDWCNAHVADDDLDPEEGRERESHVTARYGFALDFDVSKLADLLKDFGPVTMTLGKVSRFRNPEADVLKVDVDSPDLQRLYKAMDAAFLGDGLDESTHGAYKPHLTICYLQPDHCAELDGDSTFSGQQVKVDSLLYSLPNNQGRTVIQLTHGN